MSTLERLFLKIYEQRDRVETQLRQQQESYCQALACNLAVDGRRPPPWLWPSGTDADPKELNKDQFISEILFPLVQNNTSSADYNDIFTLHSLKDTCFSQPHSFFSEMRAFNKHFNTEVMDRPVVTNDKQDDVAVVEPESLEASAEYDPLSRFKRSRSRQRDLEVRLSKNSKDRNHPSENNTMDNVSGRIPVNHMNVNSVNNGSGSQSRLRDQNLDCLEKLVNTAKVLDFVEDTPNKAKETEIISGSVSLIPVNLALDMMGDVAPSICDTGNEAEQLASAAASCIHSALNMTFAVASNHSESLSVVEPKKILLDGNEERTSNEESVIALKGKQGFSDDIAVTGMNTLRSVKENSCRDPIRAHCSVPSRQLQKEDVLHISDSIRSTEASGKTLQRGPEEKRDIDELVESNRHSNQISYNDLFIVPSLSPSKTCRVSEYASLNTSVRDCILNSNVSWKQDILNKISSRELVKHTTKEGNSDEIVKQLTSQTAFEPPEALAKHILFDRSEKDNLNKLYGAPLVVGSNGGHSATDHARLDHMQSVEGLVCRDSIPACIARENLQLPVMDAFPTGELMNTEEERTLSEKEEEKLKLLETIKPDRDLQENLRNNKPSEFSAISSGTVIFQSSENVQGGSFGSPEGLICTENIIKETSDSLTQLLDRLDSSQNDGPTLFSSEMLLESEGSGIALSEARNRRVSQSKTSPIAETQVAISEACHFLRNTCTDDQAHGSSSSDISLLSRNKYHEFVSGQETVAHTTVNNVVEKFISEVSSYPSEIGSAQAKPRYSLRRSQSIGLNGDSEKGCVQLPQNPTGSEHGCSSPKPCYFLRSSTSQAENAIFSRKIREKDAINSIKMTSATTRAHEISWPKRKMGYRSKNILATSPRLKSRPLLHMQDCIDKRSGTESRDNYLPGEKSIDPSYIFTEIPVEDLHQSQKICMAEGGSFKINVQAVMTPAPIEQAENTFLDSARGNPMLYINDGSEDMELGIFKPKRLHTLENDKNRLHVDDTSKHQIINSADKVGEFIKDGDVCNEEKSSPVHHTAGSPQLVGDLDDNDENMPEFEGFSLCDPSIVESEAYLEDSDLLRLKEERASMLEELCRSRSLITPGSHTTLKYKIHEIPDVHQSLPAGFLEQMNLRSYLQFTDGETKQYRASEANMFSSLHLNLRSEFDCYLAEQSSLHSIPSSSTGYMTKARKPPLTPPVEKSCQRLILGRRSSSSGKTGSNPELTCFRIDEDTYENGYHDGLGASQKLADSSILKASDNRTALLDVSSAYQYSPNLVSVSKEFLKTSLESMSKECYVVNRMSALSSSGEGYPCDTTPTVIGKNYAFSASKKRIDKVGNPVLSRSGKPGISSKANERNKSLLNLVKGFKPKNIVSNMCSFVPLVKKKQDAAVPVKGKKDIKVKALEAAEVAKRLEERKQHEREMRKGAAKIERERLEQENIRKLELKQKEMEEKRKKVDNAAKKRQREEEEKREKQRKRRCTEDSRKHQKEQEERLRIEKQEKDLRRKVADEKERRKKMMGEAAKQQLKSVKGVAGYRKASEAQPDALTNVLEGATRVHVSLEAHNSSEISSCIDKVVRDSCSYQETIRDSSQGAFPDGIPISKEWQDFQSYEMSPYFDSDDEDGEEENRRKRKRIPLWARRESLEQVILSQKDIDPLHIFSRKASFNLSEVILPCFRRRPL